MAPWAVLDSWSNGCGVPICSSNAVPPTPVLSPVWRKRSIHTTSCSRSPMICIRSHPGNKITESYCGENEESSKRQSQPNKKDGPGSVLPCETLWEVRQHDE